MAEKTGLLESSKQRLRLNREEALTEFGQLHFQGWLRLHITLVALALGAVLAAEVWTRTGILLFLAALLAVNLAYSLAAIRRHGQWGEAVVGRRLLRMDLAVIALTIFVTGGLAGGFAVLYLPLVFTVVLLFGQGAAVPFALGSIMLFVLQFFLDAAGVHASAVPPPLIVEYLAKGALLLILLLVSLFLVRAGAGFTQQLRASKREAEIQLEAAERIQQRWELVNAVALRIQEATTPAGVYAAIGEQVEKLGLHCAVLEWAEPDSAMRITYLSYTSQTFEELFSQLRTSQDAIRLVLDEQPVLKRAVETRACVFLPDAAAETVPLVGTLPRPLLIQILKQFDVVQGVFAPLLVQERMLGVLAVFGRELHESDMAPFAALAQQAASALDKARLYQDAQTRTRELQALYEASRLLNASLDVRTICDNSVNSLRDYMGYRHVSIYFVENDCLRLQVQCGYEEVLDDIPLNRGIMARALVTRQVIFVPDVKGETDFLAALPDVQSEIAVPLVLGERALGVLNVETLRHETGSAPAKALASADVQLLSTFANQLVVAIENARLYEETRRTLAQMQTLHAASQAVNANLNLEAVLERVAVEFIEALRVDSCTILDWDPECDETIVLFDLDPLPDASVPIGDRMPLRESPSLRAILETKKPLVAQVDDEELTEEERAYLRRYQWQTALFVPLLVKGRVRGIIELGDRKLIRAFRRDDLQLAESLASQAAVAVENARLYRNARRRLRETETLYRFARELGATLEIKELGKRALEAAARIADFDVGEVSLVRASDNALVPLVITGEPDTVLADCVLPSGKGISGWVVRHGQTARVGDVTRDPRYHPMPLPMRSEICLPLRAGDRTIGVLNLEAKAPNAFDAHTEQLLVVFANQLAIAIENARLYEQTKRDADVKAALLRELSHRVKNNLAAITSLLYMALDEPPETRERILNETLGRVQSMSLAHALLARSAEARVDLLELGRQVLNDTTRHLARPHVPIEIQVQGDPVAIAARQTTTLALVLNELATNALRHGFENPPLADSPTLCLMVQRRGGMVEFQLQDNGGGLPPQFSPGLGLNLVRTLVEKDLHGRFEFVRRGQWTCAEVRFQLEENVE